MSELYARKRSKWIAGVLAFFIPGIGHMYLGLMVKGIVLMLLIALNITAIVFVSMEQINVLSVVLLSLLIPIIYFYNLFDALQSTDNVNDRIEARYLNAQRGLAEKPMINDSNNLGVALIGVLILAAMGIAVIILKDINLSHWLFNSIGSMMGAIVLIGAGVGLWFWEMRGGYHKKE